MKVAVFCGSYEGNHPIFNEAVIAMAQTLVANNCHVIYGGGGVGLMGLLADTVLENGGLITGVVPTSLANKELAHQGLTELIIVHGMHERKKKMSELSDAFIAMPGAVGTLEEIVEQWTWAQLGIHNKPVAFLNVDGFFNPLLKYFDGITLRGLMDEDYLNMLIVSNCPSEILKAIDQYNPPRPKWSPDGA